MCSGLFIDYHRFIGYLKRGDFPWQSVKFPEGTWDFPSVSIHKDRKMVMTSIVFRRCNLVFEWDVSPVHPIRKTQYHHDSAVTL
jgi:hypothetical protein